MMQLLDVESGELRMPEKLVLPANLNDTTFSIFLKSMLLYNKSEDVVIQRIFIKYDYEETELLQFGVQLVFYIPDWKQRLATIYSVDDLKGMPELKEMAQTAIGFARGALYEKSKQTPLNGLFLPIPDMDAVLSEADYQEVTKAD